MKQSFVTLILTLSIISFGCSGMKTVKGNTTVSSGTNVSFDKLMNPAFAKDYIDADIITEVEFFAPNKSKYWHTKIPKGHMVFQVVPLGGKAKSSPIGEGSSGEYVFIQKENGNIIFELKQGDRIEIRGGTRVRKGIIVGNVEFIEFMATSIKKL